MTDATEPEAEDASLLLSLATSLPAPGRYTPMDRYRDYRKLFLGSEDGQRVLRDLLAGCHMFRTSFDKDRGVMAFKEGERNVGLRLMAIIANEPRPKPTQANRKPPEDDTNG
jgi:hypothetical protein